MIPILYESTLADATFITNGICRLSDVLSCTVVEERNGEYTLELEYPLDGIHADEISVQRIIKAKANDRSDLQCFRISRVTKTMDGKRLSVKANHISYDLSYFPVTPFNATVNSVAVAITAIMNNSVNASGFFNSADYVPGDAFTYSVGEPKSIRSCLLGSEGSVLDRYGGEYEWDNRLIKWHTARGSDNGVTITYGKNLTSYEQETNIAEVYCGILPYFKSEDTVVYGDIQYSSNAADFPFPKSVAVDFSSDFDPETPPTVAQLNAKAVSYINANSVGTPKVSFDVSFFPLWQDPEYKAFGELDRVALCDTVTVQFTDLKVRAKAKVVKTTYNSLLERYDSIELGSVRANIADTIAGLMDSSGGGGGSSSGGGGSSVTVDPALDGTSSNPVENQAIVAGLDGKMQKWDLVWTNPNINNAFAAQTLSPSFAGYDFFLLIYGLSNTSPNNRMSMFLKVGEQGTMNFVSFYGSSTLAANDRSFYFTNNQIHFNDCVRHVSGQSSSATYNNGAIPQKIYGIKNS